MIDRAAIQRRRDGYHAEWMKALANANALNGAMQAMDELLADIDAPSIESLFAETERPDEAQDPTQAARG